MGPATRISKILFDDGSEQTTSSVASNIQAPGFEQVVNTSATTYTGEVVANLPVGHGINVGDLVEFTAATGADRSIIAIKDGIPYSATSYFARIGSNYYVFFPHETVPLSVSDVLTLSDVTGPGDGFDAQNITITAIVQLNINFNNFGIIDVYTFSGASVQTALDNVQVADFDVTGTNTTTSHPDYPSIPVVQNVARNLVKISNATDITITTSAVTSGMSILPEFITVSRKSYLRRSALGINDDDPSEMLSVGGNVKATNLSLTGGTIRMGSADWFSGTTQPTGTAPFLEKPVGSFYFRYTTGTIYYKHAAPNTWRAINPLFVSLGVGFTGPTVAATADLGAIAVGDGAVAGTSSIAAFGDNAAALGSQSMAFGQKAIVSAQGGVLFKDALAVEYTNDVYSQFQLCFTQGFKLVSQGSSPVDNQHIAEYIRAQAAASTNADSVSVSFHGLDFFNYGDSSPVGFQDVAALVKVSIVSGITSAGSAGSLNGTAVHRFTARIVYDASTNMREAVDIQHDYISKGSLLEDLVITLTGTTVNINANAIASTVKHQINFEYEMIKGIAEA